jgi:hypothetical protein
MKKPLKLKRWFYSVISKLILGISINKMIKLSKKDPLFKKLLGNFRAMIKITSKDEYFKRIIEFNGNGNISYKKALKNEEVEDASLIFRTVKDMFIFLKNYGDIHEGMLENRFELSGNLNILLKYQFLTNYYNPKKKKIQMIESKG